MKPHKKFWIAIVIQILIFNDKLFFINMYEYSRTIIDYDDKSIYSTEWSSSIEEVTKNRFMGVPKKFKKGYEEDYFIREKDKDETVRRYIIEQKHVEIVNNIGSLFFFLHEYEGDNLYNILTNIYPSINVDNVLVDRFIQNIPQILKCEDEDEVERRVIDFYNIVYGNSEELFDKFFQTIYFYYIKNKKQIISMSYYDSNNLKSFTVNLDSINLEFYHSS